MPMVGIGEDPVIGMQQKTREGEKKMRITSRNLTKEEITPTSTRHLIGMANHDVVKVDGSVLGYRGAWKLLGCSKYFGVTTDGSVVLYSGRGDAKDINSEARNLEAKRIFGLGIFRTVDGSVISAFRSLTNSIEPDSGLATQIRNLTTNMAVEIPKGVTVQAPLHLPSETPVLMSEGTPYLTVNNRLSEIRPPKNAEGGYFGQMLNIGNVPMVTWFTKEGLFYGTVKLDGTVLWGDIDTPISDEIISEAYRSYIDVPVVLD